MARLTDFHRQQKPCENLATLLLMEIRTQKWIESDDNQGLQEESLG
jgi:hypothetical protein